MGAGVGADVEYLAWVLVLPRVDLRDVRGTSFSKGGLFPPVNPPLAMTTEFALMKVPLVVSTTHVPFHPLVTFATPLLNLHEFAYTCEYVCMRREAHPCHAR